MKRYEGPYVNLGKSGVKVSRIAFGCGFRGMPDEKEAEKVIREAMDTGINFIDCSNRYMCADNVLAETVLGRALKGHREEFIVTSKTGNEPSSLVNGRGLSRQHIIREIDKSLSRLQTDYIDLYILHIPDPTTDLEETLRAMESLTQQGKIRYMGMSNYKAWEVVSAYDIQHKINAQPVAAVQNAYGLLNRTLEEDMFEVSGRYGTGIMVYNVLGAGLLGGKYGRNRPMPENSFWTNSSLYKAYYMHYFNGQPADIVETVRELSGKYGVSMAAIATAWVLEHHQITAVVAGTNTIGQFGDYLEASDLALEPADIAKLDTVSYGTREEFIITEIEKKARQLNLKW
ncbi:aldo/keto reductase [Enterocloster citroniae]|uniref:aldo/keto reductase n=1 Tax=Enterocloster citroniae TaxID=358743 RepID=UPI00349E73EC